MQFLQLHLAVTVLAAESSVLPVLLSVHIRSRRSRQALYALGVSTEQAPVYKAVIVIIIVAIQAPPFKDYMKKMSAKRQLAKGGVA